jgi:hypothetical protein
MRFALAHCSARISHSGASSLNIEDEEGSATVEAIASILQIVIEQSLQLSQARVNRIVLVVVRPICQHLSTIGT